MSRDVVIYGGTKGPVTLKQFVNAVNETIDQLAVSDTSLTGLHIQVQPYIRDGATVPEPYTEVELSQHFLVNAQKKGENFDITEIESISVLRFGFYPQFGEDIREDNVEEFIEYIVPEHPNQTNIDESFRDRLKECLATRLQWSVDTFASRTHETWVLQNAIAVAIATLTDGIIDDDNGLLVDSRDESNARAFLKD
jgi:hypothetical protein